MRKPAERASPHWVILLWLGPALGILSLAFGDLAGRASNVWADPLYWAGLCLIYAPAAARVFIGGQIGRSEGLTAVLSVTFGFTLVRILAYPTGYALNDELQHWRTLQDIVSSGRLFAENPILPVSPAFPGLELPTDALIKLTGLPEFAASMCVLVVIKQTLTLALFLTFERVARSTRFATIGVLMYLMNPGVLYDDGQFAYEILGLALAVLSLYLLVNATTRRGAARARYLALAIPTMGALVVTHHVSGLLFVAFLIVWTVSEPLFDNGLGSWRVPLVALMAILPMLVLWYVAVAQIVWWYLAPYPEQAAAEIFQVITGTGQIRALFSHTGASVPLWEQLATYAAVAFTLCGMFFAWFVGMARYRLSGLGRVFAVAAAAYLVSLALHFVPAGEQGATRLMGWSLIPGGFLLALAVVSLIPASPQAFTRANTPVDGQQARQTPLRHVCAVLATWANLQLARLVRWRIWRIRVTPVLLTLASLIILLGDISTDAGFPWFHTPGPYMVGADARSITPESIAGATWMLRYVGPNHRLASDEENALIFATYGRQFSITPLTTPYDPSVLFTEPTYDNRVQQMIDDERLQYLVTDLRLTTSLPAQGNYFGGGAQPQFTSPLSQAAMEKFSSVVGVDRVYDSGNIVIYRVG